MHGASPPHGPRIALSARHERWVLGLGLVLLASGAAWLLGRGVFARPDEFGAGTDPLGPWWLRLHGAAAMGFLVALGTLLPVHVRRAWQFGLNRRSGAAVLGVAVVLIATGYALYYVGSEALRPLVSALHWGVGLAALPLVLVHRSLGRRSAERRAGGRAQRRPQPRHGP